MLYVSSGVLFIVHQWPIKVKFYVKPPLEGEWKFIYVNGPGHMTKMTITPTFGKNLNKSSSELEVWLSWIKLVITIKMVV